ncbi:beta-ketoacyl synthase N-terminal-like domain-containing protein [Marinicella sediminis]|uniref:Beta-ketoacyl synthase N-terminal-like domain-containing protein n=1 Tax=Marinicella sediminis TaxID=1792834 RepID=A0ABV7JEH6_9GAMM|nr:beta-ketoacyl synthase N-terminal-like domain-containing protein [Marinicella sediminis]
MKNSDQPDLIISGLGVTTPIGQGAAEVTRAMLNGNHEFSVMNREGRQYATASNEQSAFLGAEITDLCLPESLPAKHLRTASWSSTVALATLHEAWQDADLSSLEGHRIGLIVGGSNFQQREIALVQNKFAGREAFLRPAYAMNFMDSDTCALCSEVFGIKGFAYTLGGASASGQIAIIQAAQAVQSGQVDACIVVGALMDLSYWECQGFTAAGAMGSLQFAAQAELAARPFDRQRDGFIFGENCGAIVIERSDQVNRLAKDPYARISGWGFCLDGNRNPNPSSEGQITAINQALEHAQWNRQQVDYINPHATGSPLGDETELSTIRHCGLNEAWINTSKSLIGHGLSSAGTVECILTLLQMKAKALHPCRNLEEPICEVCHFVPAKSEDHTIKHALTLSFGFGGVNSALCLARV